MERLNDIDNKIMDILAVFYIFFSFTNRLFNYIDSTNYISYIILAGCGNIILFYYLINNKVSKIELLLILICISASILKVLITGDIVNGKTLFLMSTNIGIAMQLIRSKKFDKYISAICVLVFIFYSFYMLTGTNAKLVHENMSKNHISVNVIFATSLLLIIVNKNTLKVYLNIIISFIALLFAIWSTGRGGIISIGIMFILISLLSYKYLKKVYKIIIIGGFILVGIRILMNENIRIMLFSVFYKKSFFSDIRFIMIQSYLDKLNIFNLFKGLNITQILQNNMLENIHNSYFSIHTNYGLFGLIIIFIYGIALLKSLKYNKIYFILLLTILLRAWSDTILIYYFDFIIYYMIIDVFKNQNIIKLDS